MSEEKGPWFGPGKTARQLGVTTKTLRVYEREGLVTPRRAASRWRLYGPAQIARLHQIIVLRDLGLPLKSIKRLIGSHSRLRDVLRLQRDSLQSQQDKIGRAIAFIEKAQRRLEEGQDLSLDDLSALTKETVVQLPADGVAFASRLEALIAEQDPTGQGSRAIAELKKHFGANGEEAREAARKAVIAEAARLIEAGDINSEAAKDFVRRMRARAAGVMRAVPRKVLRDAYAKAVAETEAGSGSQPFDPAFTAFFGRVARGMRARGELD